MGEMVTMNDLEWRMLSYYVIYYEKFRKVLQLTEKVGSFKYTVIPENVVSED